MRSRHRCALVGGFIACCLAQHVLYVSGVAVPGGDDDHDFEDEDADHTSAGMAWAKAGEKKWALKAFESAVQFTRNPESLTNLGVTHMNMFADYQKAETFMVEAWKMAVERNNAQNVEFVEKNLDILEEHKRSREPISEMVTGDLSNAPCTAPSRAHRCTTGNDEWHCGKNKVSAEGRQGVHHQVAPNR